MLFEYNLWQHLKSVTISGLSVKLKKKDDIATTGEYFIMLSPEPSSFNSLEFK